MDWPSGKPRRENQVSVKLEENMAYGVPSTLIHGFSNVKLQLESCHPLERAHKIVDSDLTNFSMLKSVHGLHAPLRLLAERRAASHIGRLPFLPSSNLMLDVLQNKNETIGPEDVFNDPSMAEVMGRPHSVVERELEIL